MRFVVYTRCVVARDQRGEARIVSGGHLRETLPSRRCGWLAWWVCGVDGSDARRQVPILAGVQAGVRSGVIVSWLSPWLRAAVILLGVVGSRRSRSRQRLPRRRPPRAPSRMPRQRREPQRLAKGSTGFLARLHSSPRRGRPDPLTGPSRSRAPEWSEPAKAWTWARCRRPRW